MAIWDVSPQLVIFYKVLKLLSHSKVAKAELYLIGDYHNKLQEQTYYIETLVRLIRF